MPEVLDNIETTNSNKARLVDEVIQKLHYFVKLYAVESLFVAGGYCRSLYLGRPWDVNDIDVASAFEEQALQLGGLFASEVLNSLPKFYHRTGTAMVEYESELGNIKVEFQGNSVNSYMYNQEIKDWMYQEEIKTIPLMSNIYGRDFTINSLIYSLHTGELNDPTGRGAADFEKKSIISLLPPYLLVKYNPLAILRAIRFAMVYDFSINNELGNAMRDNVETLIGSLTEERIMRDIVKILKIDAARGLDMMKRYGLDKILINANLQEYIRLEPTDED